MNKNIHKIVYRNNLKLDPVYNDNYVCLVFSSNNTFIKYTSVMIKSIIENSKANHYYDIIIFNKDISEKNMCLLESMIEKKNNLYIRFVDIKQLVFGKTYYTKTKDNRLTEEAYYRIYIPHILSEKYTKAIYLDGDMVVKKDLYELNEIDIKNFYIGAIRDFLGIAQCYSNTMSGTEREKHLIKNVGINSVNDYFNSGLMILNLEELRRDYDFQSLEQIISKREWKQHDQDVLNHICKNNKAKFIDPKWNVIRDYGRLKFLPIELKEQYYGSTRDPYIIHYGGSKKPWKGETSRESDFWYYAIKTPFYNEIVKNNITYFLNRDSIDLYFFKNRNIFNCNDQELLKEYVCFISEDKFYKNGIINKKESKETLLPLISLKIKLFIKYSKYSKDKEKVSAILDVYSKIKKYRKQAIFNYRDVFTPSKDKIQDLCIFLKSVKESFCKKEIIGRVGILEYNLIMRGTYLSWLVSLVPDFYYMIKERFSNN